jgi:FAD/FMN-containing dehydrogenase
MSAGIRIRDLISKYLVPNQLAMINLGSIADQSIAGAISTSTHGTGLGIGSLATQVVAMTLVTGQGELLRISANEHPELLPAARVSLGALGVITQVTIQCIPECNLRLRAEEHPFDDVLDGIEALTKQNERVRLYWFPNTDSFLVTTFNKTDEPATPDDPEVIQWFKNNFVRHDLFELLLKTGERLPDFVDELNRFAAGVAWQPEERVGPSNELLLNAAPVPRHIECEYAVPFERAAEALRTMRRLIDQNGYRANVPVDVRFVAADENMLSPSYSRDVCYIGAHTSTENFAKQYYAGFETAMKALGGRPHWGKCFNLTAAEARACYPMYDAFNEIRKRLDPKGIFVNQLIHDLFE